MKLAQTTPLPNVVIDKYLQHLSMSEIKVLLVVVRKTLGWTEGVNGRKQRDWISSGQLAQISGLSKRAITGAISSLLNKRLIQVTGFGDRVLSAPSDRRGQTRLYFELAGELAVDNELRKQELNGISNKKSAHFAEDIGNKVHELVQKLRITKETVQN
ncbi:MAG TPA: replication protein [Bacteroidia bacterium]|nr:replication protein [Bacteroidia bacterium]